MAGLPNLEQTRSLSRYGLSQVTVIFKDRTDLYFCRQLVNQRIQEAREAACRDRAVETADFDRPGEIYLWTVESQRTAPGKADGTLTPTDLREIGTGSHQTQLRNVPGHRNQFHRQLRQEMPGGAQSGKTHFLWPDLCKSR